MALVSEQVLNGLSEQLTSGDCAGLWIIFHDYNARSCAKWIPAAAIPETVPRGGVFARANLNFTIDDQQVPEPTFGADTGDFFAVPDPATLAPVPYRPGIWRVYSYLMTEDGELWDGCARGRLQLMIDRLAEHGLTAQVAFEPEVTLYRATESGPEPADAHPMYSVARIDNQSDLLLKVQSTLAAQGVDVVQIGSEYGLGQVEINLRHQAPMKAADDLLTFKETMRALARDAGLQAVFMPKVDAGSAGNGVHVHISLWHDGTEDSPATEAMPFAIGGVLKHAAALCAISAPTVNSYKRLQPASWAPAHVAYAHENRAALVRIPGASRPRLEFRAGDHTANPYLQLIGLFAAILDGIEQQVDPGAPSMGDIGHMSEDELVAQQIEMLPRSVGEAFNALEHDQVILEALGPVCGPEFMRVKRFELARYQQHVSDWERSVYFDRV